MANVNFSTSQNTLEALKEFLLHMKRTIEQICAGHTSAAKHANLINSQSSHDFGLLSCPPKDFLQGVIPENGAKPGQVHNWFSSQTMGTLPAVSTGALGRTTVNDCNSSVSEVEIGNALSVFLQDMKKTIQIWSYRYLLLNKGRDLSVMEVLGLPNSGALQVSAQVRNGKAKRPQLALANQGRRGKKAHLQSHQNRRDATSFSLQDFSEVMGSDVITHAQSSRPQGIVSVQGSPETSCHAHPGQIGMEQSGYNGIDHESMVANEVSRHDRHEADNNNTIVLVEKSEEKNGPRKRKPRKEPTTPVITQELTIRNFQCKVEVVESPDWLPKGWITELKTRTSGGSAGSKDKYYYDPVSKRRCRSRKEVFSLLETGKLGRYKRRTNRLQQGKKSPSAEASLAPMTNEIGDINKRGMPTNVPPHQVAPETTSSSISPAPLAISPGAPGHGGAVNNMFLPYRPGQPSDWLVYESLASLPRPVLENLRLMEPNASKLSSERGPTPWPWFLNHPESSMRPPFVDRLGAVGNAMSGGRDHMSGIGVHVSAREQDGVAKRPRKPSKRGTITS